MAQCSPIWKDSGADSTYGCLKNPPRIPIADERYGMSYLLALERATQGDELKRCLMLNVTMRFVSRVTFECGIGLRGHSGFYYPEVLTQLQIARFFFWRQELLCSVSQDAPTVGIREKASGDT